MLNADREFEFTFNDGGIPGVFLPKLTRVRGRLPSAAFERFLCVSQNLDEHEQERLLQKAFERRLRINRVVSAFVELKPCDITASISDADFDERRGA